MQLQLRVYELPACFWPLQYLVWLRHVMYSESADPFGTVENEPLQTRDCFILKMFGTFYCLGA